MSLASAWKLHVSPSKYCRHPVVITRALRNSVVLMASGRVEASVTDSEDRLFVPSDLILYMKATIDE